MKRLLSALLIALFAVCALTGCGSGKSRPEPEVTAEPTNEPEVTAEPTESAEKDGALTFGPIEGASSEPAAEGRRTTIYETLSENEVRVSEYDISRQFNLFMFTCGEVGPAQARGEGRGVTVSIVNCETMDQLESRVLADPADIAYLSKHIAEAEYRPVTDDEPELAADPKSLITINVYKADGTEDHFRFTKNGYIAHSTEPFSAAADLDKAEHVSLEPVEDVVRMHAAAIASHNMYAKISDAGDPFNRSELSAEELATLEIKFESAAGAEFLIADEEAAAFCELIPHTPYAGTLIGAGYTIPEDAVRITAIDKTIHQRWGSGYFWTELYLTREGCLFIPLKMFKFVDTAHFGGLAVEEQLIIKYQKIFPEAAEYAFGL